MPKYLAAILEKGTSTITKETGATLYTPLGDVCCSGVEPCFLTLLLIKNEYQADKYVGKEFEVEVKEKSHFLFDLFRESIVSLIMNSLLRP